jgi:hypothetical protein
VTTEPDPEQVLYAHLVDELSGYHGGLSSLGRLVSRLEPLIDQLEERGSEDWVRALRRNWGQLEILYALALDKGRGQLTDDEERDVAEIIDGIREQGNSRAAGGS